MCSGAVKRRSCCYSSTLYPRTRAFLPHTVGISNDLSHTLDVYIRRPLVYGYALDNTTTDLSSHVPCVYRETPLGYLIYLRKALWPSCLDPYTKNSIWGDYYTCTHEVYHEWYLLDNPGERPDYLNLSCHFKFACLTYSLSREMFVVFLVFHTLG